MTTLCFYTQSLPVSSKGNYPDASSLFNFILKLIPRTQKLIVYFSSLHFGVDNLGNKYLHLNDQSVSTIKPFFTQLSNFLSHYSSDILEFRFMLGGAGGAYQALYSDFEAFYNLLQQFVTDYDFISGIDLDIEEPLADNPSNALQKVRSLIRRLYTDTHGFMERERGFRITLAPVASSLTGDSVGMGGFCYKDLLKADEADMIDGFNVQIYGCFNEDTVNRIIKNDIPIELLTLGMLGDEYTTSTDLASVMTVIENMRKTLERSKGFILWESGDSCIDPYQWSRAVLRACPPPPPMESNAWWNIFNRSK